MAGYSLMLHQGVTIAYAEDVDTVPTNMAEVKPTIVVSVPRLYEKTYNLGAGTDYNRPLAKKQLFFLALKAGRAQVACRQRGIEPNFGLKLLGLIFSRLVFVKRLERLGGKLRFFHLG